MARAMGYSLSPCGLIFCDHSTGVISAFKSRIPARPPLAGGV
jgi:hypothetical protein